MGGSRDFREEKKRKSYFLSVLFFCRPLSLLSMSLHHMLFFPFSLLSSVWHAGSPLPLLSSSSPSLVGTFPGQRGGMEGEREQKEQRRGRGQEVTKKKGGGSLAREQLSFLPHVQSSLCCPFAQWHFTESTRLKKSAVLASRKCTESQRTSRHYTSKHIQLSLSITDA